MVQTSQNNTAQNLVNTTLADVLSFTKHEAIKLMQEGKRITHRHFSPDEWMTMSKGGAILLEDGVRCSLSEFFRWRTSESWEDGYSLYIR